MNHTIKEAFEPMTDEVHALAEHPMFKNCYAENVILRVERKPEPGADEQTATEQSTDDLDAHEYLSVTVIWPNRETAAGDELDEYACLRRCATSLLEYIHEAYPSLHPYPLQLPSTTSSVWLDITPGAFPVVNLHGGEPVITCCIPGCGDYHIELCYDTP